MTAPLITTQPRDGSFAAQLLCPVADVGVMVQIEPLSVRAALDRYLSRGFTSIERTDGGRLDAVGAGRALMGACGLAVVGFAPVLDPTRHTWWLLVVISACMITLLAASRLPDWSRLPTWSTLAFPFAICAALAALGLTDPAVGAPLVGVITLCFAFVGLTQPPGTAVLALPVAAITVLCAYGSFDPQILVRLLIASFVWTVLAELLARLMRAQASLTTTLVGAAHRDELTGMSNRRDLDLRLANASPGDTIVMCDLDHFKRVNDTLGHAAGDHVLTEFGTMLRVVLRGSDYCARYGGEEFLLLLPATKASQADVLVQRLREHWQVLQPDITFSAGIATCNPDRSTSETLAVADRLLYQAKAAGRDRSIAESHVSGHLTPQL